jgi:allantoin racemase
MGAGLGSMLTALSLGQRFSVVTIWPSKTHEAYQRVIAGYNFDDRCVSVRHVATDDEVLALAEDENFYTDMRAGKDNLLRRIEAEMRNAVRADGADVIILGCTCMSGVAPGLAAKMEVPVIDCLTAGYRQLELLADLALAPSRSTHNPPNAPVIPLARAMIDAAAESLADTPTEHCERCVIAVEEPRTVS